MWGGGGTEEAAIIATLLTQKVVGNAWENNLITSMFGW